MDYDKLGGVERASLIQALWREAYDAVVEHHDLDRLRQVMTELERALYI